MSDDIQFGDVEEAQPQVDLRPDCNRHFAVVAYGQPAERDLPIFVDLDVLLDMEAHAASDKTVELGGVMLGGHYHDAEGKAFVVVTDTLRAEHYESTKGSFKFTHETWEKISRQRDEFPPELQMAGWYHTHPDWGVFLSGMDMFICDNFFNKMLDVAYVIDPCRLDRAFFQWTGKSSERIRRTGGFYVTASRFREAELVQAVQALEGKISMPSYTSGAAGSPIINVQSPSQPPRPAWEPLGMFGMLALQFCLLSLIAWKLISPPDGSTDSAAIAKLEKVLEARDEAAALVHQHQRDLQVIDRVLHDVKETPTGLVEGYQREMQRSADLELALRNSQAVQKQIAAETALSLRDLNDRFASQGLELEKIREDVAGLKSERTKLKEDLKASETTIAALEKKLSPDKAEAKDGLFVWPPTTRTWILIGGVLTAVALGGLGLWFRSQAATAANESLADPPSGADVPKEPSRGTTSEPVGQDVVKNDESKIAR